MMSSDKATIQRLKSVLEDNRLQRYVKNRKSGSLDTKSLYKWSVSDRLFKQKRMNSGIGYKISIVIDLSGSMYENSVEFVSSMMKLLPVIEGSGIPFEIIGFNTLVYHMKPFDSKITSEDVLKELIVFFGLSLDDHGELDVNDDYDRVEKRIERYGYAYMVAKRNNSNGEILTNNLFRDEIKAREFAEKLSGQKSPGTFGEIHHDEHHTYCLFSFDPPAYNTDCWAVSQAVQSGYEYSGDKDKHIIIMLSDGAPANAGDISTMHYEETHLGLKPLRETVTSAIKNGVIFIGVGICSDAVFDYYPKKNTVSVYDPKQINIEVIKKLKALVKRGV